MCHAGIFQSGLLSEMNYYAMMESMSWSIFTINVVAVALVMMR